MSNRISSLEISIKKNGFFPTLRIFYLYLLHKFFSKNRITFKGDRIWLRPGTSDFSVFREISMEHEYALNIERENRIIVDLGANIGISSLYFARYYPGSKIYALEADKENFELLLKNTEGRANITPLHNAIWKENAAVFIESNSSHWARKVSNSSAEAGNVPGITLDKLMADQHLERIHLLKVDIEGSEIELFNYLSGRPDILDKIDCIIVETHDDTTPGCAKAVFDSLRGIKYNVLIRGEKFFIKLHQ